MKYQPATNDELQRPMWPATHNDSSSGSIRDIKGSFLNSRVNKWEWRMNGLVVTPGDVVVTNFVGYQHWSLVTDRLCSQGLPMLISATDRNNTVQEEAWSKVTQGKHTYVAQVDTDKPICQILSDARAQIGKWRYSLTEHNCEHFVKWASGLKVSSKQVVAGTTGAVVGAGAIALLSKNPKWFYFLGAALLVGVGGIAAAKAIERKYN